MRDFLAFASCAVSNDIERILLANTQVISLDGKKIIRSGMSSHRVLVGYLSRNQ